MNNTNNQNQNNKHITQNNKTNVNVSNNVSNNVKKGGAIHSRINFIKKLLSNKQLEPMVNFDSCDTENFTGPVIHGQSSKCYSQDNYHNEPINAYKICNDSSHDDNSNDTSNDTRYILNKNVYDFYQVINQIGGTLAYVKSGTTGHTFKGIFNTKNGIKVSYAVKVVAYPKKSYYGDLHDITRPENAELKMIKTLSYFVVKKQTPHIILPMGTFNTNIKPFVNLINIDVVNKDNKKYCEFIKKYKKKEYYDDVSILISEWANRQDFLDFVRNNYLEFTPQHWKILFFQIISVLAIIQQKFPSFRHNDLKANNILVDKNNRIKNRFRYTINGFVYTIPDIGYQIKLWDFDFACIPGVVDNAKVSAEWTNEINISPVQNRYYDLHYFFNTFIKKGFFNQFITEDCIPQDAKDFVLRIVPKKYQKGKHVSDRGRILINDEIMIPDDVLKNDPYFAEFRTCKVKKNRKNNNIIDKIMNHSI